MDQGFRPAPEGETGYAANKIARDSLLPVFLFLFVLVVVNVRSAYLAEDHRLCLSAYITPKQHTLCHVTPYDIFLFM